jgi:hypothetical protein
MKFPLGAMSLGDILDRGLKLLLARFPLLISISLLIQLPVLAIQLVAPLLEGGAAAGAAILVLIALFISLLILTPIAQAIILYVVTQEYLDRPATLGPAFSFALSRFGSLLGSVILAGLITGLGTCACIIPGIYLGVLYAFVSQVVVLENLSGMDALNRSKQLVSGFWWRVFGVVVLIQFIAGALNALVSAGIATVLPYQEYIPVRGALPMTRMISYPNYVINILVQQVVTVLFSAYLAVCTTLLYLDLRIRKEGFDLEMEAQRYSAPPEGGPVA